MNGLRNTEPGESIPETDSNEWMTESKWMNEFWLMNLVDFSSGISSFP